MPIRVVLVIYTATNAITRSINVRAFRYIVISPYGSQLYATYIYDNTVSIVYTATYA